MTDCLFCKMVSGDIKPNVVLETDEVLVFRDINPQAPTHVLIIPKRHITSINHIQPADAELIGKLYVAAREVAEQEGISESGYRTLMNCGEHGQQTVFHIHLHLLGGRQMTWPPG